MSIKSNNVMNKKEKWIYVLMVIPFYIMIATYMLTMYKFFHDHLHLGEDYIYLASIIYMVVNALNDPLLALWSDGIDPKKWGSRRLIFIRWGGVFWAGCFALTWIPWSGDNQLLIFIQYTTFMCMLDNGLSLVIMCYMALLPELESDLDNRVKMGWYTGIVILLASIIGSIFVGFSSDWILFRNMAFLLAGVVMITTFITTANLKERIEFQQDLQVKFWVGIKETFKSKSFMLFIGYNLFFSVIPMGFGLSFVYLYQLIIPINTTTYFLVIAFGRVLGPFIALQFKKIWGIKKTILIIGAISVLGTIILYIFTLIIPQAFMALIGLVFMSWVAAIPKALNDTMMSISMDEFEIKTGCRRESTFLGVNALITKPGDSIGTIIVTAILAATAYVEEGTVADQPIEALIGIKIFMLLIPALFMFLGLIFVWFYPLYGHKLETLYLEIEKVHAQKQLALEEISEEKKKIPRSQKN